MVFSTLGGEVDANPTSPAAWCLPWCLQVRKWLQMLPLPIQLLEYQTDMRRCRFDTLGKSPPAPRAGAPTARGWWVSPRPVGESDILIATGGGPPTGRGQYQVPPTGGRTSACGDQNVGLTHWSGAHPPPTGGGSPCTGGRGGFPHRYKPSSLLRPYIADTSALLMLELGSMPVVTTMATVRPRQTEVSGLTPSTSHKYKVSTF